MSDLSKESRFEKAEGQLRRFTGRAIKFSIIILFSVVAWRIAWSSFSLDLTKFDFSDLLAMILALFAMLMSVAFYFKSTDSSNQFYDNIYNFTQKTSEILGRIEERFGERLKHIDEGYGRIQSRFDGISENPGEIEKKVKETEGKEKEEKEKLKETNEAMQEMMEELAKRAELQEEEKEEFYKKLERLTKEKTIAQERISEMEEDRDRMQEQLLILERDMGEGLEEIDNPIFFELFNHAEIRHLLQRHAPARILQKRVRDIIQKFPESIIRELHKEGIIDGGRKLTTAGVVMLHAMKRRLL